MIHIFMILNYDRKTVQVYVTTVFKSKAELISYVTNQTNQWIKIRGGKLAEDGGGEIKQFIHSESLVL